MSGEIIPYPCTGRTIRAICIIPDSDTGGDNCRAVVAGFPLHSCEDGEFAGVTGALWKVQMVVNDHRHGLPIRIHPECLRRAGQ
jgi:hypothetical protein